MATTISSRSDKTSQAKRPTKATQKAKSPSENEIRILAYRLYEKRRADGTGGDASSDWTEAERLLTENPAEGADLD